MARAGDVFECCPVRADRLRRRGRLRALLRQTCLTVDGARGRLAGSHAARSTKPRSGASLGLSHSAPTMDSHPDEALGPTLLGRPLTRRSADVVSVVASKLAPTRWMATPPYSTSSGRFAKASRALGLASAWVFLTSRPCTTSRTAIS